ncbi:hypothetical protein Godav_027891, partial [Gossypium davidsonii]|nr:hypothetical protein [Gossypium davidsonii]MBA0653937.1 hypothetical protein [Gossypium klotzschianum]
DQGIDRSPRTKLPSLLECVLPIEVWVVSVEPKVVSVELPILSVEFCSFFKVFSS